MFALNRFGTRLAGALSLAFRHPIKSVLLFFVMFLGYAAMNMPNLQKDGRIEAFMHADDPALETYYEMRREYGQDNRLVITVTAPDIFSVDFLERLSVLHRDIADNVPYVAEIFSLYNMTFIQHENGGLYLEELGRNVLARGREPAELRERITSTPLYDSFIISPDGKTAAIVVEPYRFKPHQSDCVPNPSQGVTCPLIFTPAAQREMLGAPQYKEMAAAAREIVANYQAEDFEIHIAGAPVVSTEIVAMMEKDMPRFTLACVLIALVTMLIARGSILISIGALLSFVTPLFATLSSLSLSGTPMTPPTQLLIPLTLVVSLCTYIHFSSACLRLGRELKDRAAALKAAVRDTWKPIVFTSLTTAAGLLALTTSPLAPIATLGTFGAVSVLFAFCFALFWATIFFRALPKRFIERRAAKTSWIARFMANGARFAAARPAITLIVSGVVVGAVALGATRLEYSHNSLLWLPEDNQARASTEYVDARFNGTVNLEVVIKPTGGKDFRDETLMKAVEATAQSVPAALDIPVGRHTSIISFVEESNQALHGGDPAARIVPTQEKIWDELLMLEGQGIDDMRRYVSLGYDEARVSFLTPWVEAKRYTAAIETIQSSFAESLSGQATVETTGLIALLAKTSTAVLNSVMESYMIALLLVTVLMCVGLRSMRFGVLSMIANVAPFVMLLGLMGFLRIPLDTFTMLIGAIITGLIVDDTVHFFHRAKENMAKFDDVSDAASQTALEVGDALFTTTLVVMLGFAVFMFSSMSNIQAFGLLMSIGAATALVTDILIGSAIMALYKSDEKPVAVPETFMAGDPIHA